MRDPERTDLLREVKQGILRTRREIEEANLRLQREIWEGFGRYGTYLKGHVRAIGLAKRIANQANKKARDAIEDALSKAEVKWSLLPDDAKRVVVERVSRSVRQKSAPDKREPEPPEKKGRIRPRHPQRPLERVKPKPSPKPIDESEGDIPAPPRISPPSPTAHQSARPTPKPKKRSFTSRVGYFVAISELGFYESVPVEATERYIELDFHGEPDGYLSLKPGSAWVSSWYSGGVIRGLSLDVSGSHRLVYSKNGDFEV